MLWCNVQSRSHCMYYMYVYVCVYVIYSTHYTTTYRQVSIYLNVQNRRQNISILYKNLFISHRHKRVQCEERVHIFLQTGQWYICYIILAYTCIHFSFRTYPIKGASLRALTFIYCIYHAYEWVAGRDGSAIHGGEQFQYQKDRSLVLSGIVAKVPLQQWVGGAALVVGKIENLFTSCSPPTCAHCLLPTSPPLCTSQKITISKSSPPPSALSQ